MLQADKIAYGLGPVLVSPLLGSCGGRSIAAQIPPSVVHVQSAAQGNLFFGGVDYYNNTLFAKLTAGKFNTITVHHPRVPFGGSVQYSDGSLTVEGQGLGPSDPAVTYRITETGKVTGWTVLQSAYGCFQAWMQGKLEVCATAGTSVQLYVYPKGGNAAKTINLTNPIGVVVSNDDEGVSHELSRSSSVFV